MAGRTVRTALTVFLVGTTFLRPVSGQQATDPSPGHVSQTPNEIFRQIRRSWLTGDITGLMHHVGDKKVTISLGTENGKNGSYSRNQAHYIVADILEKTRTERFTFTKIVEGETEENIPYAIADRSYRMLADGNLRHDQIYIALAKAKGRWCITHMMSLEKRMQRGADDASERGR